MSILSASRHVNPSFIINSLVFASGIRKWVFIIKEVCKVESKRSLKRCLVKQLL